MPPRKSSATRIGFFAAALGLLFLGFACKAPTPPVSIQTNDSNTATSLSTWFRQQPSISFEPQPDGSGTAIVTVQTKPGTTVTATVDGDGVIPQQPQTENTDANGDIRFFWPYSHGGDFTYEVEVGSNGVVVATYDGTGYVK